MRSHESTELLFWKYDMFGLLESQRRSMTTYIDQLTELHVLETSDENLLPELMQRFELVIPELDESAITVSPPREIQISVSQEFRLGYGPRSVKGIEVTFNVPYTGDVEFFRVRPTHHTLNPPRAVLRTAELGFPFSDRQLNAEQIRREFDGQLKSVKEFLEWQTNDVRPFNGNLRNSILQALAHRRGKLQQAQAVVGSLGFPVRG